MPEAEPAAAVTESKAEAPAEKEVEVEVPRKCLGFLAGQVQEVERLSGARVELPKPEAATEGGEEETVKAIVRGNALTCARARVLLEDHIRSAPAEGAASEDAPAPEVAAAEAPAVAETPAVAAVPRAGSINIAGRVFAGRDELDAHVKRLQSTCKDGVMLGSEDSIFMFHLATFHPHFLDKMTSPVIGFKYGPHEVYTSSKCFYIVRTDGTEEGLSAKKCIEGVCPGGNRGKKREREEGAAATGGAVEAAGEEAEEEPPQKRQREIVSGCVVCIENLPFDIEYQDLRELLGEFGNIRFVEFIRPERKQAAGAAEDEAAGEEKEVEGEAAAAANKGEVEGEAAAAATKGEVEGEAAAAATKGEAEIGDAKEAAAATGDAVAAKEKKAPNEECAGKEEGTAKEDAGAQEEKAATPESKEEANSGQKASTDAPAASAKGGEEKDATMEGEDQPKPLRVRARFGDAESAAKCLAEFKEVDGAAVTCTLLSGEEERVFWERLFAAADKGKGKGKKGKDKGKGKGKDYKGKGKGKGKDKGKGKKGKK